MNPSFSGKQGLLFHRNMIEAMDVYGARLSKDFQAETGIPVTHSFINRSMGGMKLKFKPGVSKEGIPEDFKAKLGSFLKKKKDYLKAYVGAAVRCTLNDTDIKAALRAMDPEKTESTQWMGDSITVDVKEKKM
jgi:hypothetical protein